VATAGAAAAIVAAAVAVVVTVGSDASDRVGTLPLLVGAATVGAAEVTVEVTAAVGVKSRAAVVGTVVMIAEGRAAMTVTGRLLLLAARRRQGGRRCAPIRSWCRRESSVVCSYVGCSLLPGFFSCCEEVSAEDARRRGVHRCCGDE
jgi:hypothetical protein